MYLMTESNIITENYFETLDKNMTACLMALGHHLFAAIPLIKDRHRFCFKRSEDLKTDIKKYWKREIVINPHKLISNLNFINNELKEKGKI